MESVSEGAEFEEEHGAEASDEENQDRNKGD